MLLIGTQLVIYALWLWSAVRAASSTLRWNYPAITNMQLNVGVKRASKPPLCPYALWTANMQPVLPLVVHSESCLKKHRGLLAYWNLRKSLQGSWESHNICLIIDWIKKSLHFTYTKWYCFQSDWLELNCRTSVNCPYLALHFFFLN